MIAIITIVYRIILDLLRFVFVESLDVVQVVNVFVFLVNLQAVVPTTLHLVVDDFVVRVHR